MADQRRWYVLVRVADGRVEIRGDADGKPILGGEKARRLARSHPGWTEVRVQVCPADGAAAAVNHIFDALVR